MDSNFINTFYILLHVHYLNMNLLLLFCYNIFLFFLTKQKFLINKVYVCIKKYNTYNTIFSQKTSRNYNQQFIEKLNIFCER